MTPSSDENAYRNGDRGQPGRAVACGQGPSGRVRGHCPARDGSGCGCGGEDCGSLADSFPPSCGRRAWSEVGGGILVPLDARLLAIEERLKALEASVLQANPDFRSVKVNPDYVNAPFEMTTWSPETGFLTLRETGKLPDGSVLFLEGTDETGKAHRVEWFIPKYVPGNYAAAPVAPDRAG